MSYPAHHHHHQVATQRPQAHHPLIILGAVYGKAEVTEKVCQLVSNNCLQVRAEIATFGDNWHLRSKSLVVVYQYGNFGPEVAIAAEGHMLTITPQTYRYPPWRLHRRGEIMILGAAYGLSDVTNAVSAMVCGGRSLHLPARNSVLGDGWYGVRKVLTVTYLNPEGMPTTVFVEETGHIAIGDSGLNYPIYPQRVVPVAVQPQAQVTFRPLEMMFSFLSGGLSASVRF